MTLEQRLRNQYGKGGIYAGTGHFHDYWCRDSMFASFGALAIGDFDMVKTAVSGFLDAIRADGHVAMRIGSNNQVLRYLGLPTSSGVFHAQDKGSNDVFDSNSLLLIIADKYEEHSGRSFDRTKLASVAAWQESQNRNGLLHEGKYASWDDSLKHTGPRLYTNVCYYRAQLASAKLFLDPAYMLRAEKTKEKILQWWNGAYFVDGANPTCMVAGNLLAILWGIATPEQSVHILQHIAKRKSIVPPAGFWIPGRKDAFLPFFLIHLHDYHGMMEWSWLAATEIACYRAIGDEVEADRRTEMMLGQIEKYGTLYEVYENDKPVKRLIYRSEPD
ncbi:MAG: hypothetical protein ABI778_06680, partial [Ignavibacteriota bacterium]